MAESQQTVYVVEDDEAVRDSLGLLLKSDGKAVKTYDNATPFLKDYSEKMSGCIVLDIRMPGMDGIEVLREIKNRFPLIEVIMLTGHGTTESAVEGMKLGAFDYLLKPAEFDELTQKLEGARKRKDEQEARIRKAEARLLVRRTGGT